MKVLLLSASTYQEPHPVYPIGLDYVAAALAASHEVKILDANCYQDRHDLMRAVDQCHPEVIGLSLRNIDNAAIFNSQSFINTFRDLVTAIRRRHQAPIILGGSAFSLFPEKLLEALGADYGIIGEGEHVAPLLSALEKGAINPDLPGVLTRGRASPLPQPWAGPISPIAPESLPHMNYYLKAGGILNLQTKRGCPFKCIYCSYPVLEGKRFRLFSPEAVGRQARLLADAGASFLFITDSVFNGHEEHSLAVAESIRAAGVTIPWGGFFIPRNTDKDYFRRLASCGCTHVEFGTETLSPDMLEIYRKPFDLQAAIKAHNQAQAAGLFVSHYFLLGGPQETRQTVLQTLEQADNLSESVFFFYCGIRILPGTALERLALKEGSLATEENLLEQVFYHSPQIGNTEILDLLEAHARGRSHWITPQASARISKLTRRLYSMGHKGLLWERLIQQRKENQR